MVVMTAVLKAVSIGTTTQTLTMIVKSVQLTEIRSIAQAFLIVSLRNSLELMICGQIQT